MFVDALNWKQSWESVGDLPSGGQGSAKKVIHKTTGQDGFLKILNKQNDIERRARFFREATAYHTCDHTNIPSLIESNAHNYQNSEYKVYIVNDFISGETITKHVENHGSSSRSEAEAITHALIDTIEYCHEQGWVHRDIKPDNIIINQNINPILLDFGIAYKKEITPDFATELDQEVGNRFLRLPELRIDSPMKQDVRSDLSLIGAIYFYLLTAIPPIALKDENGLMPHQRTIPLKSIKEKFPYAIFHVLAFFDKVFSEKISDRFYSAVHMRHELVKHIKEEEAPKESGVEQDLAVVLSAISSKANSDMAKNKLLYEQAMNRIREIHSDLGKSFEPTYINFQTGYVSFVDGLKNVLGFCHFANQEDRFAPHFLINAVGEELVVYMDDNVIFRTSLDAPKFSDDFDEIIRKIYIKGMRSLVEGSVS